MARNSLEKRILARVNRSPRNVFLRRDFAQLSEDYDQVGRALKSLVARGQLLRLGYGLYAKARVSPISGRTVPTQTLPRLGHEALKRLKVRPRPSSAQRAYTEGRSTQVPTGRVIGVKKRISRKIGFGGVYLEYERV